MSTPVDIPQNINIQVSHADKVVEPKRPDVADNSARQSSLELANKEAENKHPEIKRDRENKKKFKDHYAKNKESKKELQDMKEKEEKEKMKSGENIKDLDIGTKIDISM